MFLSLRYGTIICAPSNPPSGREMGAGAGGYHIYPKKVLRELKWALYISALCKAPLYKWSATYRGPVHMGTYIKGRIYRGLIICRCLYVGPIYRGSMYIQGPDI